jgi:hypothetical protein
MPMILNQLRTLSKNTGGMPPLVTSKRPVGLGMNPPEIVEVVYHY